MTVEAEVVTTIVTTVVMEEVAAEAETEAWVEGMNSDCASSVANVVYQFICTTWHRLFDIELSKQTHKYKWDDFLFALFDDLQI